MIQVEMDGFTGITCAQRKDGSRCILWENNDLLWVSAEDFDMLMMGV